MPALMNPWVPQAGQRMLGEIVRGSWRTTVQPELPSGSIVSGLNPTGSFQRRCSESQSCSHQKCSLSASIQAVGSVAGDVSSIVADAVPKSASELLELLLLFFEDGQLGHDRIVSLEISSLG